jgi:hypothetical protein
MTQSRHATCEHLYGEIMADRDELTPALTRTWNRRLAEHGFRRVGRRDLQSLTRGIVRLFNFQISACGSRDFCVNVAAFTLCGNDIPVLQPGFRVRNPNGSDVWLPSRSVEDVIAKAEALIDGLGRGKASALLEKWRAANLAVHRIKQR